MKRKFITSLLILSVALAHSQVYEVDQLSKKVSTIENQVAKIQEQILAFQMANDIIKKDNYYFREALRILDPVESVLIENVKIDLISCIGNKQEQTVILNLMLTTKGIDRNVSFRPNRNIAVDAQGNTYSNSKTEGSIDFLSSELFVDVPVKARIIFQRVPTTTELLRRVNIEMFYNTPDYKIVSVIPQFQEIKVSWE